MHSPFHTEAPQKVREVPAAAPAKSHHGEGLRGILCIVLYLALLVLLVWGCYHVFQNPTAHYPYHTVNQTAAEDPAADAQGESQASQTVMQPVTNLAPNTGASGLDVPGADTVVATFGDKELTNQEFIYYYWDCFYSMYSTYGEALTYYLSLTTPFDQQMYTEDQNWHRYFASMAINTWQQTRQLCDEAQANGYTLSAEDEAYLDTAIQQLGTYAAEGGYDSDEAYLQTLFDPSADVESYRAYNRDVLIANGYAGERYETIYNENYDPNAAVSYCVNVRHILIQAEDASNADSMAAAKADAEELYAQWQQDPTEENFIEMAGTHTQDPGSQSTGGLYEDVYPGQMVTNFNDWCFDESRKPGDHGIVETEYGYHIMYFVGNSETVYSDENTIVAQDIYNTWLDELFGSEQVLDLTANAVFTEKPARPVVTE